MLSRVVFEVGTASLFATDRSSISRGFFLLMLQTLVFLAISAGVGLVVAGTALTKAQQASHG